ncbi:MAG: hypothetical protein ACHQQQ_01865 [Bacteroidota bacterium]
MKGIPRRQKMNVQAKHADPRSSQKLEQSKIQRVKKSELKFKKKSEENNL